MLARVRREMEMKEDAEKENEAEKCGERWRRMFGR